MLHGSRNLESRYLLVSVDDHEANNSAPVVMLSMALDSSVKPPDCKTFLSWSLGGYIAQFGGTGV